MTRKIYDKISPTPQIPEYMRKIHEEHLMVACVRMMRLIETKSRTISDPKIVAGYLGAMEVVKLYSLNFAPTHPQHPNRDFATALSEMRRVDRKSVESLDVVDPGPRLLSLEDFKENQRIARENSLIVPSGKESVASVPRVKKVSRGSPVAHRAMDLYAQSPPLSHIQICKEAGVKKPYLSVILSNGRRSGDLRVLNGDAMRSKKHRALDMFAANFERQRIYAELNIKSQYLSAVLREALEADDPRAIPSAERMAFENSSPSYDKVLDLFSDDQEFRTREEIATLTGLTPNAVRDIVYRARKEKDSRAFTSAARKAVESEKRIDKTRKPRINSKVEIVLNTYAENPTKSVVELSAELNIKPGYFYVILSQARKNNDPRALVTDQRRTLSKKLKAEGGRKAIYSRSGGIKDRVLNLFAETVLSHKEIAATIAEEFSKKYGLNNVSTILCNARKANDPRAIPTEERVRVIKEKSTAARTSGLRNRWKSVPRKARGHLPLEVLGISERQMPDTGIKLTTTAKGLEAIARGDHIVQVAERPAEVEIVDTRPLGVEAPRFDRPFTVGEDRILNFFIDNPLMDHVKVGDRFGATGREVSALVRRARLLKDVRVSRVPS